MSNRNRRPIASSPASRDNTILHRRAGNLRGRSRPVSARLAAWKGTRVAGDLPYDLLAIDLDRTLLDDRHRLPERNRVALHAAHEAGLRVVVCTGRSFTETRPILDAIGLELDAAITVGGALLSDAATGRTIESRPIPNETASAAADWFRQRGYTVLWLNDASVAGFDGYLIDADRRHEAVQRWLDITPCRMRCTDKLPGDDHPPLRITVVDDMDVLDKVAAAFRRSFDHRMTNNVIRVPMYGFTVLEAFDAAVDKWYGIRRLCRRWGIDPRRTVAVGDDVNDLPMIRHAGLGVAVANANPAVRSVADRVVAANEACGVAELIETLLRS